MTEQMPSAEHPAPECEHHWVGGNDGSWCTKCKVERPAVASERDAEQAALLARLQEPNVRETAAKRVADYRQHGCHWAEGTCAECQGIADAVLTKIAEMLK